MQVCVAENTCGMECLQSEDCYNRGYPFWYTCLQDVNRCLPASACDGKASGC